MTPPTWIQTTIGAVLSFGFGAADAWQFHSFAKEVDLLFLVGALAASGIHVAYAQGKASG